MFVKRLKELRALNNISQAALADKLGLSQQAIAKWETEKATPDPDMIAKLANLFGVSADYLLGVSNERQPGVGVKAIDDPEVNDFMKTVVGEFRLTPGITPRDRQEIMEDLAEYFKFKMQQKKQQ